MPAALVVQNSRQWWIKVGEALDEEQEEWRSTMNQEASAPARDLKFETSKTDEETKIVCSGKIISDTSALLQSTVQPLIPGSKRLVLDLTDVSYVDSSGMGALVKLWISTKRADCDFKVINLNERIKDLLRVANLSKILEGDHEFHNYLQ